MDIGIETTHTFYAMELELNQSVTQVIKQIEIQDYLGVFVNQGKRAVGIGVNLVKPNGDKRKDASKTNYHGTPYPFLVRNCCLAKYLDATVSKA